MSVYVVTNAGAILEYNSPDNKSIWIRRDYLGGRHVIYWNNCNCCHDQIKNQIPPHTKDHEVGIAWIDAAKIMSIGFEPPKMISGIPIPFFQAINRLKAWMEKRSRYIPKNIKPSIEALDYLLTGGLSKMEETKK